MTEPVLIPLDDAVACLWPEGPSGRLRLRIEPKPLPPDRMRRLIALGGFCTILDPVGSGDALDFWHTHSRDPGWANEDEVMRAFASVHCAFGATMRERLRRAREAA